MHCRAHHLRALSLCRPQLNAGTLGRRVNTPSVLLSMVLTMEGLTACSRRLVSLPIGASSAAPSLSTSPTMQPHFAELTEADTARLDKQRALVATTLKDRYAAVLTRTKLDLPLLQRLLDDGVFAKSQTFELQSLGVVFGDVLATETGLHWMMVTDEYGTDPTLVRGASSLQVNALTMISKRVERAELVDVAVLFTRAAEDAHNITAAAR